MDNEHSSGQGISQSYDTQIQWNSFLLLLVIVSYAILFINLPAWLSNVPISLRNITLCCLGRCLRRSPILLHLKLQWRQRQWPSVCPLFSPLSALCFLHMCRFTLDGRVNTSEQWGHLWQRLPTRLSSFEMSPPCSSKTLLSSTGRLSRVVISWNHKRTNWGRKHCVISVLNRCTRREDVLHDYFILRSPGSLRILWGSWWISRASALKVAE